MSDTFNLRDYPLANHTAPRTAESPPIPRRLARVLSLADFEVMARRHLPRPIFAYVSGGCETDRSLRENRSAFEDYDWVPRVLVDTSARTLETTLFGHTYAAPFGIAPMGISALTAYRGDLIQARAAALANVPMIMSGSSLIRMEEICTANPQAWFQMYVPGEPDKISALLERVANAGFRTLVLTADVPVSGNRENNLRAGFSTPLRPTLRLALDGATHPRIAHVVAARHAALRKLAHGARRADSLVERAARLRRTRSFELGAFEADPAAMVRQTRRERHPESRRRPPRARAWGRRTDRVESRRSSTRWLDCAAARAAGCGGRRR
jgi:hypothetical protein